MPTLAELMAEDDATRLAEARAEIAQEKAEYDALSDDEKAARTAAYEAKYGESDVEKFDCYECGSTLSEGERERDKCDTCGRHYHEDLWDEEFEDDDAP